MTYLHDAFELAPADPILHVISRFRADPRPAKIDLGVGVYRDADGATPVMKAVRQAETELVREQQSKSYLGISGNIGFLEQLSEIVFGQLPQGFVVRGCQTPGGSGALRLLAEVLSSIGGRRFWIPAPTWGNHQSLLQIGSSNVSRYPCINAAGNAFDLGAAMEALVQARPGDIVLLHGACHNPTGIDPTSSDWQAIANLIADNGLVAMVDLAYQGFGDGLDADAAGLRHLVSRAPEVLAAISCSKNFALYRERTGAAFVVSGSTEGANILLSQMERAARSLWSMPPDHGAEVVRRVLSSPDLRHAWAGELTSMRERLIATRIKLAERLGNAQMPGLAAPIAAGKGIFATLPLRPAEIERLSKEFGIYLVPGGRINIAGLPAEGIDLFAEALATPPEARCVSVET